MTLQSKPKSKLVAKKKLEKSSKPIKKLKLKADTLFSKSIRYRDCEIKEGMWVGQCITCDRWYDLAKLQNGHFIKRSISITRFNDENCNAICDDCNTKNYTGNANPRYAQMLDLKYGDGTAKKLKMLSRQYHSFTEEELEDIIHDSQEQIDFYTRLHV